MPYRTSEDLWPPLALLVVGLFVPGLAWTLAGDLLALYLSPIHLTLIVVTGYGLAAWYLIDRGRVDRTSFLLVSLIWPWPFLIGVLILLLLLNQGEQIMRGPFADVFRELTTDWPGSIFGYAAVYAAAGLAVFGLSKRYDRRAGTDERLPSPSRLVPAVVALVVVLAVLASGANAVTTSSATIESVGPGTRDYHDPTVNATVAGPAAEYRVTVTAPDGTAVTTRLSRADMRGGTGTVAIELDFGGSIGPDELPVQDGDYRVRVTSLAGLTVDTAAFHAADAAAGSLTTVQPTDGSLPGFDDVFTYTQRDAGEERLGFELANEGAFHAEMSLVVDVPDDPIVVEHIPVAPGERLGLVIELNPETVDAIRGETNGTVTAHLYVSGYQDEAVASTEVTLQSP